MEILQKEDAFDFKDTAATISEARRMFNEWRGNSEWLHH
jgi:hypothetical protein